MVRSYQILNPQTPSEKPPDSILRNVTLSVGSRSLDHMSKCVERTTDLRTLNSVSGGVLNECYVNLSLNKLRELDGDTYAHDQYILSRSKFLDKNLINIMVIKLKLEDGETLCDGDYEYLNQLLTWNRNDIYLMPLIEYGGSVDRQDRIDGYTSFVKRMLNEKDTWMNNNTPIGMTIPDYLPRPFVNELFNQYSDCGATFIGIDFNNSRMSKPSDQTGTVLRHFKICNDEKFFLYGINVKPYKKGADKSAWDIYMAHGSFNAIGPTHTRAHVIPAADNWESLGRIFDKNEISYPRMDVIHRDSFIEWMHKEYDLDINQDYSSNRRSLYSYLKRYNFEGTNDVLGKLSSAIGKDDMDYINEVRKHMPEEMKGISILEENKIRRRRK